MLTCYSPVPLWSSQGRRQGQSLRLNMSRGSGENKWGRWFVSSELGGFPKMAGVHVIMLLLLHYKLFFEQRHIHLIWEKKKGKTKLLISGTVLANCSYLSHEMFSFFFFVVLQIDPRGHGKEDMPISFWELRNNEMKSNIRTKKCPYLFNVVAIRLRKIVDLLVQMNRI